MTRGLWTKLHKRIPKDSLRWPSQSSSHVTRQRISKGQPVPFWSLCSSSSRELWWSCWMWLGRRLEELAAAGRVGQESHLVSHPDFHILNRAECWGLNAYDCDLHVYWWASLHSKCQEISGKLLPFSPFVGCFHFDLVLLGATFEISKHLWWSSQSDLPRPTKELMQKGYGIGSGISLFIATNICERRLDRYLRKMKRRPWKRTTGSKDSEPYRQVHYGQCWDSHFLMWVCIFPTLLENSFWLLNSIHGLSTKACPTGGRLLDEPCYILYNNIIN